MGQRVRSGPRSHGSACLRLAGATLVCTLALSAVARADGERRAAPVRGTTQSVLVSLDGVHDDALRRDLQAFDPVSGQPSRFSWILAPDDVSWPGAEVYSLSFPSPRPSPHPRNNTVWCRWYPARGLSSGSRAPLAIVLHHLGGDFTAEAILADFLARSGIHAMEVEFPYYGLRKPRSGGRRMLLDGDLTGAVAGFQQGIADIRRALDWALARGDVDPRRVGVVGVSLGGIIGGIAAGVDPRLRRNVLVIAGGDLAEIIFYPSRETREVRRAVAKKGLSKADVRALLRPIEPLRYASRIHGRGMLLLCARYDEVMPRVATDRLIAALPEATVHWYPTGHYTVATFLLDLFRRIRVHFAAPVPAVPPAAAGSR